MTSIPANLPRRHVDYQTGHILRVDPVTGAVISRKLMIRCKDSSAEYGAWAVKRRSEDLSIDYAIAKAALAKANVEPAPVVSTEPVKRGRPKAISKNPTAAFMPFLVIPDPLPWVVDTIHGSISTSAGSSNGKINVKARGVIGAMFLSEISAEACLTSEHTLRTAQRIAKAARHAAHGIASYVERHPKLKAEWEAELGVEALFRASMT